MIVFNNKNIFISGLILIFAFQVNAAEQQSPADIEKFNIFYNYFKTSFKEEKLACETNLYSFMLSTLSERRAAIQSATTNIKRRELEVAYEKDTSTFPFAVRSICMTQFIAAMSDAGAKPSTLDDIAKNDLNEVGLNRVRRYMRKSLHWIFDSRFKNEAKVYLGAFPASAQLFKDSLAVVNCALSDNSLGLTCNIGPVENEEDRLQRLRASVKDDVVAQVLNYASGFPELGDSLIFFHPKENASAKCIYELYISNAAGPTAMAFANLAITGNASESMKLIDLNQRSAKNIQVYKINKTENGRAVLKYQSTIENTPYNFTCDSNVCNIERLRSGWDLVAKKCVGGPAAF